MNLTVLHSYLKKNPETNKLDLVSKSVVQDGISVLTVVQLVDATRGLEYLHENRIAHGDGMCLNSTTFFTCSYTGFSSRGMFV